MTARQIEAARRTIVREMKRRGKVWIRIFPAEAIFTHKPPETRMGSGKGNVEYYVAGASRVVIMFEVGGLPAETATRHSEERAIQILDQDQDRGPSREESKYEATKVEEIRKLQAAEEIRTKLTDLRDELMKLRFQQVTGQLTDTSHLRNLRRNIARMETILRETDAKHAAVEGA